MLSSSVTQQLVCPRSPFVSPVEFIRIYLYLSAPYEATAASSARIWQIAFIRAGYPESVCLPDRPYRKRSANVTITLCACVCTWNILIWCYVLLITIRQFDLVLFVLLWLLVAVGRGRVGTRVARRHFSASVRTSHVSEDVQAIVCMRVLRCCTFARAVCRVYAN